MSIDVSNVETLKIETTNEGEYSCGWLYIVDDVLSIHTHTKSDWIVKNKATCIKTGQKVQYCTECGKICVSEPIPANGHKAIDIWIESVSSTCATPGKQVQYCSVCGDIAKTQPIDCLPHTEGTKWEVLTEASCIDVGKRVKRYIECNTIIETEDIEMVPHDFSEWLVTSKSWGAKALEESRSCTQCGLLETREIESRTAQWLIYISIFISTVVFVATSSVYPLEFRKILTLCVICHHVLLVVLLLCCHVNLLILFLVVVLSISIFVLSLDQISLLSSVASILGWGAFNLFGIQNIPFFAMLSFLHILIFVWLKNHHIDAART